MNIKVLFSLLLLIGLVFFNDAQAQVVQLGSGTTDNAINVSSPVNTNRRKTVCQFVYTAAEIVAAGATGPNTLSQMGFYVTANPVYDLPGYTVKIKHTTQTDVGSALGGTGWTTVKNSFTYAPAPGGYDMIVFDTPFVWDGVNNIGVEICWSQVQPSNDASGQCRTYASTNGYRYRWSNNAGSYCGTTPNSRINTKPQAQLTFKTTSTWNGSVSTDWFNDANWDAGTPDSELNALIAASATNMPTVSGVGAECKNLEIENLANLTLGGSNSISIYGNWTNNGVFTANTGNVILTGTSPNVINGEANQTLYDLTVSNVNGASITSGSINLYGSLNVGIAAGSFNTGNAITLISDANGTARIPELSSLCLYTLDMSDSYGDSWNGAYITVYIDGIASGVYFAKKSNTVDTIPIGGGSSIELVYTSGIYEWENTYTLYDPAGTPVFSDGPTPSTGSVYTGTSNCAFFNPIAGNITMQRYIDAGATNWRFLSSAVTGATLSQFNDDFETSGYPGATSPDWPTVADPWSSVRFYDETVVGHMDSGFVAATNASDVLGVGKGAWVWSGDTIIGTQPFTIDVTGPPNAGTLSLPLSYTNTGSLTDDGWSMVGNPYPCTINWDSPDWNKSNINNAIYIWNPDNQQFASYILGVGTNGGSRYVASSQAFWVQANAASPSLQISESCKVDTDTSFLKQAILDQQLLRFTLQKGNKSDEAVLRFIDGATTDFDAEFDAKKITSDGETVPGLTPDAIPHLAMINNSEELTINSYGLGEQVSIPIKVTASTSGLSMLTFDKENLIDLSCAVLEDLETGVITDVMSQSSYTFYLHSSSTDPRFMLHVWNNKNNEVVSPTCFESNDGQIIANASGQGPWDYNWSNDNGVINANNSNNPIDVLNNISAGVYYLEIVDQSSTCESTADTIQIENPEMLSASSSVVLMPTSLAGNGEINLIVTGGKEPYQFAWSNGAIAVDLESLDAGVYEVDITDANGCAIHEVFVLDMTTGISQLNLELGIKIYPNPAKNRLVVEIEDDNALLTIYNLNGQSILTHQLNSNREEIDISDVSSGIYFYKIDGESANLTKGKIIVSK